MGHIDPTKEVFAQFRADDRPGPIHMLNLVRLRAEADYPDGRKATGAEAYAAYGRESGPVFERLGGRIVWQGRFELMLIGPQDERWDHCFIAEYPSVAAFAEMIRDPVYREAVKHRQAAVEDSRLIRHAVLPVGKAFGFLPELRVFLGRNFFLIHPPLVGAGRLTWSAAKCETGRGNSLSTRALLDVERPSPDLGSH